MVAAPPELESPEISKEAFDARGDFLTVSLECEMPRVE